MFNIQDPGLTPQLGKKLKNPKLHNYSCKKSYDSGLGHIAEAYAVKVSALKFTVSIGTGAIKILQS
jgi:hypothetical protein